MNQSHVTSKTSILTAQQLESKRFNTIFIIEMMERFGFYAFNVIVVMFFIAQLHLPETVAYSLFGAFSALLYVFIPIGGYVGDKILGTKQTIILGGVTLFVGYFILASSVSVNIIYLGMATIVVGNGLFKSNPAALLSKIYDKNDSSKLDAAFSLYYMAINVGSFISMIFSPVLAHSFGWQYGFALAAFGLILGLGNYLIGLKNFKGVADGKELKKGFTFKLIFTIIIALFVILLCTKLLQNVSLTREIMFTIVGLSFIAFIAVALKQKAGVRGKMISALILTALAIGFFTLYQQMYLSLTFFGVHNARYDILGIPIHPEQFQIIDPLTIFIFAPIFALVYRKLGRRNGLITTKFAIGLIITAFAFLLLVPTLHFNHDGLGSSNWVILSFFFLAIGELFVSALGLSMMSQLVPEKFMGFATGVWFLAIAVAGVTGSMVADFITPTNIDSLSATQSLTAYCHGFLVVGIVTLIGGGIVFIIKPFLDKHVKSPAK